MTDADRNHILAEALRRAIAALEALASDPANRSEITPDISALRADLEYATSPDG